MGGLHYRRHFCLLIGMSAFLVVAARASPAIGLVGSFAVYGALHASMIAVTLLAPQPWWRKPAFAASSALLSGASVGLSLWLSRFSAGLPGYTRPALLLSLSAGLGAASYALALNRFFAAKLPVRSILSISLGCIVATLAILRSGIYLEAGSLPFALAWWGAFSAACGFRMAGACGVGLERRSFRCNHRAMRRTGAI